MNFSSFISCNLVILVKYITTIMLLILTFIAHSFLNYLNSKINIKRKRKTSESNNNNNISVNEELDNTTEQILFNESFDVNYLLRLKPSKHNLNSTCDISTNSSPCINDLNNLYRNKYNNNSFDNNKSIDITTASATITACINSTDYLFDDFNLNCEEFQICKNNNTNDNTLPLFDLDDEDLDYLENNRVMDTIQFIDNENSTIEGALSNDSTQINECIKINDDLFLASNSSFNSTSSSLNATTKTMFNENTSCTLTKKRSSNHHCMINQPIKCLMFKNNTANNTKQKKFRTRIERSKNERKFYQRQRTSSAKISLVDLNELIKLKRNLFDDEKSNQTQQAKKQTTEINENIQLNNLELIIQQLKQAAVADARTQNLKLYRPSFKVEKLLNDSRGMKKYLIDYDFLMLSSSQQQQPTKITKSRTISLNNLASFNYGNNIEDDIFIEKYDATKENDDDCFEMDMVDYFDQDEDDENINSIKSNRCSSGYLSDY